MRRTVTAIIALAGAAALLAGCDSGGAGTRDSIRAVGSSTVYPFAKAVAEDFTRSRPEFKSPIIESTGTGGGINLFCSGIGASTPDIANASRRMKAAEFAKCQANGVTEVTEIPIGFDGLALASAQGGITMNLTPELVYRALAANPYGEAQTARTWRDVDPSLPDSPILLYGPPSTSGTRDSFEELVMVVGCEANPEMAALADSDEQRHREICTRIRSDGAYVDQGEQDNLIVQKIQGNPNAVGLFGYSYLESNSDKVQGLSVNGVQPSYDTIASGEYPGARSMYIYVKRPHLDAIPGLRDFISHWIGMSNADGPLVGIGLIAASGDRAARATAAASDFPILTTADFE